jgi:hypothetical protein
MRTTEQAVRKVISAKEAFVGIDVHEESWHVTVRSDGEESFNGRIPGQYRSLKRILERYRDVRITVADLQKGLPRESPRVEYLSRYLWLCGVIGQCRGNRIIDYR